MVSTLVAVYCVSPRLGTTIKTNCMKVKTGVLTEIYLFFKKGLGLVSPGHFVQDFSKKIFLNWPEVIVWFLLLEISPNICIVIVCYPVCDVIIFEFYLGFLIKPYFYMTTEQKFENLKNEKSFDSEMKSIFHHFKRPFSC